MRRLLALSLMLSNAAALAQGESGPYVGLAIGKIDLEDTLYRIDYGAAPSGQKLTGGYRFNENLAFEVTYAASGTFTENESGVVPNSIDQQGRFVGGAFSARFTGEVDILEARVLAHTDGNLLFGFGLFSGDVSGTVRGTSVFGPFGGSLKDSKTGLSISIGALWNIERWGIRAEYEYFDVNSPADLYTIGVGMQYGF